MLSPDEHEAVAPLCHPLPPTIRRDFLAAVSAALDGTPTAVPGITHRIARQLPRFYRPPERETLPPEIARAYASVFKEPRAALPPVYEPRWTVWGGAYGGSNRTTGDLAIIGSHDLSARTVGGAAGLDYHLTPDTVVGLALGGGGTNRSKLSVRDALWRHHALRRDPSAELTRRGFTETDAFASGFGLAFGSRDATDTESELGARFDRVLAVYSNAVLALRGRVAWAHDWATDPTLMSVFQALPGASFIVNGATLPKNSALTSAGAELRLANGVTLLAKFDGEFAIKDLPRRLRKIRERLRMLLRGMAPKRASA